MRHRSLSAYTAFNLVLLALLAGCSSSQTARSVPDVPYSAMQSAPARNAQATAALLQSNKSQSGLIALQLAGKLPAPVLPEALQSSLQQLQLARPQLAYNAGARVAIWASDTNFNYLVGQDATGLHTVTAVDLSKNSCFSPVALKVDRGRNVWVGCELTSQSSTNGVLQKYSATGVLEKQYLPGCPSPVKICKAFSGYGYDGGLDSNGNVFASLNLYSIEICNPSCTTSLSAGFEWWPKGNAGAVPKLISVGSNCSPICGVGYMDVDASGDLWFTFVGYDQNNNYGAGLGEITTPTTKPALTIVEPIGTYGFFGGVYVSGAGKTLNVIDQKARTISQYQLPLAQNGSPFNVLGPTPLNAFGIGDPVSGGFNQKETKLAIGDTGGWLDIGVASGNTWSSVASPNFYSGIDGAAYTPSDK